MNVTIVTTTINEPTKATRKFAKIASNNNWKFILVGDTKTPHELYQKMKGVIYLHPDYQESKYKELSDSIGWRSIQRRNIGFIEAFHETNCDVIATVDDDNIPYDNWGSEIYIGKPVESGPLATASDYLYNMEKVLMQLEKIVDKNPNSDISAKQVITLVLNTLKKIRDKQTN